MTQTPPILATKNYGMFKKIPGNRDISSPHLKILTNSIKNNSMLSSHPIIVDREMYVIDGQHRLEAAKKLNFHIYYLISDVDREKGLIESNVVVKKWDTKNFIHFYSVAKNNIEYVEILQLINSLKLKPKAFLSLVSSFDGKTIMNDIKLGKFTLKDKKFTYDLIEFYKQFMEYAHEKRMVPYSMFSNSIFTKAFRWFFQHNEFSKEIFMKKLDHKWYEFKPMANSRDWYKFLIYIYNVHNKNKIRDNYDNLPDRNLKISPKKKNEYQQMPLIA